MNRQRLGLLFASNLVIFTAGNGLLPIWPIYAQELGASAAQVGIYLAMAYLMLAVGTLAAGFLVARIKLRVLFLGAAALTGPAFWLAGYAGSPEMLTLFTSLAWFLGGIEITLLQITTGRFASWAERGRSFSWLYLALPLGALLGGVTLGRLADGPGFPTMFRLLGLGYMILVPLGYLALRHVPAGSVAARRPEQEAAGFPPAFIYLLLMVLLMNIAIFTGRLGTSLRMESLNFSATAVSGAAAISSLAAIPFIFWFGRLSDLLGRPRLLAAGFLATTAGMLILAASTHLAQFWLAVTFLSIASYASGPVISAFATDLLPPETLNKGLATLNSVVWTAGVVGFAAGGVLFDGIGTGPTVQFGAVLSIGAMFILGWSLRGTGVWTPISGRRT